MNVVPADAPPAGSVRANTLRDGEVEGAVRGYDSGLPFTGKRGARCSGNNDTCKGWKVAGSQLCAGHLRSQQLAKAKRMRLAAEVVQ